MVRPHNPEAPRDSRGASSWARRVNDSTVEWLAAVARIAAVLGAVATVGALVATVWAHGPDAALRCGVTTALLAGATLGASWLGFVRLGNPEWKDDDAEASE